MEHLWGNNIGTTVTKIFENTERQKVKNNFLDQLKELKVI